MTNVLSKVRKCANAQYYQMIFALASFLI